MAYKGVFFDLYGTLLIYGNMPAAWADWLTACYEILQPCGLTVTMAEFAEHCDGMFIKPEPPAGENQLTVYERRIKSLTADLRLAADDDAIRRAATASAATWQRHITLDAEAIPILEQLHCTCSLALISNFDHPPHLKGLLDELKLREFFTAILISGETGFKKPHPRMFSLALEQTGLQPHEVIYVGDTADDINGATAAGIRPILIRRNDDYKHHTISDFNADPRPLPDTITSNKTDECRSISALSQIMDLL